MIETKWSIDPRKFNDAEKYFQFQMKKSDYFVVITFPNMESGGPNRICIGFFVKNNNFVIYRDYGVDAAGYNQYDKPVNSQTIEQILKDKFNTSIGELH